MANTHQITTTHEELNSYEAMHHRLSYLNSAE